MCYLNALVLHMLTVKYLIECTLFDYWVEKYVSIGIDIFLFYWIDIV